MFDFGQKWFIWTFRGGKLKFLFEKIGLRALYHDLDRVKPLLTI